MGECAEVGTYGSWRPCLRQGITKPHDQGGGKVTEEIRSKVLVPPSEQIPLVVAHMGALVGQYVLHVAVEGFGEGVAGGLRTGEVPAFYDTSFSHLRPSFGVCELGKGGRLGGSAFASYSYSVHGFTIWTLSLFDGC